jgi:DNA-binding transcriptional ArsR family regulator
MIRVHFTGADFARTSVSQHPAPLVELKLSLMMLRRRDNDVFFGRWRRQLRSALPGTTRPLWDLVSGYRGPAFIDPVSVTVAEGLDAVHATPPGRVQDDIARIYAHRTSPPPSWLRDLLRSDAEAWTTLHRALDDAYQTTLARTWPAVRDRHRAEFARYALTAAASGVSCALTTLVPGSQLREPGIWQLTAPYERDIHLNGRGLVLLPTFHWTGMPLAADLPGQPALLAYPAGPGLPVPLPGGHQDPLPAVLGQTRSHVLRLLADEHTTTGIAQLAGISPASASAHLTALRGAGLISTVRDGAAARHRRTSLGTLLAG